MTTPDKQIIDNFTTSINTEAIDNENLENIIEFTMNYKDFLITDHLHPQLLESAEPFDFETSGDPTAIADKLAKIMYDAKGVGISGNQIHYCNYRVIVLAAASETDDQARLAMFNPTIVNVEGEVIMAEEACLSYPGLWVKVKRPDLIRVRYTDEFGTTDTIKLKGFSSKVVQHQMDILDGVKWWKKANPIHLDQARRALTKQKKMIKRAKNRLQSYDLML